MQLDFEDIMASALGRIVVIALFFASALWVGSIIGGIACYVGHFRHTGPPYVLEFLMSPLLLINFWIVPNVAFLAIMMVYVFVADGIGHVAWGVILGVESLFVMLGWGLHLNDLRDIAVAWSCWFVLLVMAETGVWLHRQMRINRWAHELAELRAENAMRNSLRNNDGKAETDGHASMD
ncbi:MAG: hypothetical protein EOP85_04470 [Verrucomicrobiaceae bacterium]|nr:MAG: hypothetical protein EOP85_04470 [Verrucomicrobiaceae bacterium]